MFAWVARLAARRVVWILVGLVVYALLNAAGVRAAHTNPETLLSPGVDGGQGSNRVSSLFDPTAEVTYNVTATNANYVGVVCSDGSYESLGAGAQTTTSRTGKTGCYVYITSAGSGFNGSLTVTGTVTYTHAPDPTPTPTASPSASPSVAASPSATPTPTPGATAGPLCDPYCNVALVPEDRARLDNAFSLDGYIASITALLLTSILVVTGLRR